MGSVISLKGPQCACLPDSAIIMHLYNWLSTGALGNGRQIQTMTWVGVGANWLEPWVLNTYDTEGSHPVRCRWCPAGKYCPITEVYHMVWSMRFHSQSR